jgi:hypothetical protein
LPFRAEHGREGVAAALTNDNHGFALAGLVELEATVAAMLGNACWLYVSPK